MAANTAKNNDRSSDMYPGGKNRDYQRIINLIPPHRVYIETHVGSGAVLRNKLPAKISIAIDLDPEPLRDLNAKYGDNGPQFVNADAVEWLLNYHFQGDEFVYADPPYVLSSRRQQRHIYRYEYTDADHEEFLGVVRTLPCKIMISGYLNDIYQEILQGWNVETYQTMTRGNSIATEYLWMNYSKPVELHDYRFLGNNYRERERIKRKKRRWANKLKKMPTLERQAILAALRECDL